MARAVSRPTVLDRYQPYLHRRWNEGCHDAAVLHAEITTLGYRGSLRTVYRYLQPLRTGAGPAPLTTAPKISEVTGLLQPQLLLRITIQLIHEYLSDQRHGVYRWHSIMRPLKAIWRPR